MTRTINPKLFTRFCVNFRYAVRLNKPLLTARLIKTYLAVLLFKKRPLRYVDFAIGYDCNLKCEHCFATALRNDSRRRLTLSEHKRVVKEAMRLGAVNFSFQGGEPILYTELHDYIKNTYPSQNLISVTTNATLLNERNIRELKRCGVDILTISLDSAIAEEHDGFRGVQGTFDKVMNSVKLALKNGMNVTLGGVASHKNIRSKGLIDLIELAHRLNVIIFLALAVPIGRWADYREILLTDEDREYLYALVREYPLLRTDFEANYVHYGCGAVKEILYLTPYGDVLACPFIHVSLGNISEESLESIREKALRDPYFGNYHKLCLAAEDAGFMEKYSGSFYGRDGKARAFGES